MRYKRNIKNAEFLSALLQTYGKKIDRYTMQIMKMLNVPKFLFTLNRIPTNESDRSAFEEKQYTTRNACILCFVWLQN